MLTKKHFEFLADHIARNSAPTLRFNPFAADNQFGTCLSCNADVVLGEAEAHARNCDAVQADRTLMTNVALALIQFDGNPRFDRERFEHRVAELASRYV